MAARSTRKSRPWPFSLPVCATLWLTLWLPAFRAAGYQTALDTSALLREPRWPILRVLGPLWLLRLVAQAIARRLAWQQRTGWRLASQYPIAVEVGWVALLKEDIAVETRLDLTERELRWFLG